MAVQQRHININYISKSRCKKKFIIIKRSLSLSGARDILDPRKQSPSDAPKIFMSIRLTLLKSS